MVALHHALEDEDPKEIRKINNMYRNGQLPQSPIINNPTPKYYKGKSEKDAYYGYKLLNGQAGDLIHKLIRCFIGVDIYKFKKKITKQQLRHFYTCHESIKGFAVTQKLKWRVTVLNVYRPKYVYFDIQLTFITGSIR